MNSAWEMPLGNPPQVVAMGRNAHGFEPEDSYRLPDLWSVHLFGYDAILRLGDQQFTIRPGSLGITPPGVTMATRYYGISVHLYAHFKMPDGKGQLVPAVCDAGDRYESLYADLYDAVRQFPREPDYASAVVWGILWKSRRLAGLESSSELDRHGAVQKATDMIEQNLSGRLLVSELAEHAQVSSSYLARLFQDAYGESVVSFIRRRRMERASDLLRHSTLPVKLVASAAGFPDLQQFNKVVRGHFGMSPRAWRDRA